MNAILAGGALAAVAAAMVYRAPTPDLSRREPGAYYARQTEYRSGESRTRHWARRADGWLAHTTSRESRDLISGQGRVILVCDPVKARSTFDRVSRGFSPFASPAQNCAQPAGGRLPANRMVGETNVAGERVVVYQEERGPQVRWTEWAAPDLGCLVLQAAGEIRRTPKDPWRLVVYLKTDELRTGGYPDWLFALPADYREMSPGQVVTLITNGQGGSSDELRSVDASYYANPARLTDDSRK